MLWRAVAVEATNERENDKRDDYRAFDRYLKVTNCIYFFHYLRCLTQSVN